MPDLPALGPPPQKSPIPGIVLSALVVGAIAGLSFWLIRKDSPAPLPAPSRTAVPETAVVPGPIAHPPAPPPAPVLPAVPEGPSWKKASLTIDGPLETSFVDAVGPTLGPSLTQVVTRTLVWWVDVPGGLQRGDTLDVLFDERVGEEPVVHALKFRSGRRAREYQAYRYQPPRHSFARYYTADGVEVEERLSPSPIDTYEQITSLLRDGRRHQGVDFKSPVGTPIKATFDGVITRRNWNFRSNGNCLEITEENTGRKALYLHLDVLPAAMQVGAPVRKGDIIAASGNSGRSFAPHLHYQLMSPEKPLDPFKIHRTHRIQLNDSERAALKAEIERVSKMWTQLAAAP